MRKRIILVVPTSLRTFLFTILLNTMTEMTRFPHPLFGFFHLLNLVTIKYFTAFLHFSELFILLTSDTATVIRNLLRDTFPKDSYSQNLHTNRSFNWLKGIPTEYSTLNKTILSWSKLIYINQ